MMPYFADRRDPARPHARSDRAEDRGHPLFERYPEVKAQADAGYRGLAREFPKQVSAPPEKPGKDAGTEETAAWYSSRTL